MMNQPAFWSLFALGCLLVTLNTPFLLDTML